MKKENNTLEISDKLNKDQWDMLKFMQKPMKLHEGSGISLSIKLQNGWPNNSEKYSSIFIRSFSKRMEPDKVEEVYHSLAERGLIIDCWEKTMSGLAFLLGKQTTKLGDEVLKLRTSRY